MTDTEQCRSKEVTWDRRSGDLLNNSSICVCVSTWPPVYRGRKAAQTMIASYVEEIWMLDHWDQLRAGLDLEEFHLTVGEVTYTRDGTPSSSFPFAFFSRLVVWTLG
eukprot:TRINITY_DN9712_c1_g3_i1.p1 TRINITY_DN9712_c1_g3~~TRINITY_DN9712_c1_g3_i1.p1  ORF type:complete len:107 (+),score=12.24 TRINITY_DN9712_c1_g3_i1:60-380(+)